MKILLTSCCGLASRGLPFWEAATHWLVAISVLGAVQHTCDHSSFRHSLLTQHCLHYADVLQPRWSAQHLLAQHSKTHDRVAHAVRTLHRIHNDLLF